MTRKERALIVKKILGKKYPNPPIPLNHFNNFSFLIAVLLSAQCTDERVNQVTPKLFKLAKSPLEMSKLSEKKIYSIIKPCGLGPKKSKATIISTTLFFIVLCIFFCKKRVQYFR